MKTLVLISNCSFPLSAVAGSVLTGRLPQSYSAGKLNDIYQACKSKMVSEGEMIELGSTGDGVRVVAFTARSGSPMLSNMVTSFLELSGVDPGRCRVVEIKAPLSLSFMLGEALLGLPPASRAGLALLERQVAKIYPDLVKSVKLDGQCQMSDN